MRARLKAHAQRQSKSPPPPAPSRHGAAAAEVSSTDEPLKIPTSKIRTLIGPGGSTIKAIQLKTGADIRVDDDGSVHIRSGSADAVCRAREMIIDLTMKEIQVGETYRATVVSIKEFGCFVEVSFGKQGLVHVSELASNREKINVAEVVKIGDVMVVKCVGVDESGRARLSRKAAMKELEGGSVASD
jgi:polyribonucleotide nucleotidyltransferase